MRKRLLALVLSVFMLANSALSIAAETTSSNEPDSSNGVVAQLKDLGEDFGVSPVRTSEEQPEEFVAQPYANDEIVRVSIVLYDDATLDKYSSDNIASNKKAVSYRNSLQNKQDSIMKTVEKKLGHSVEVKWNLTLAANMISVEVPYGDIEAIKAIDGVKDVVLETRYNVCEDDINTAVTTSEMIFAQDVWAAGYTGAGSLVAIIDTGTNQNHISFDPSALEYSLTKDGQSLDDYDLLTKADVSNLVGQLNAKGVKLVVDSVYKNLKIPFAFNYVDKNYKTDHSSDNQGEHGSHVSGIAAANRYVKVNGEFVEAAKAKGAVGVAPDAQIITMKVFGSGGGAYDSDYMVAIEDAIILGADSINLSLGSSTVGSALSGSYESVMNKLVKNNSVVCISAGNNYAWSYNLTQGDLYNDDINFATGGSPGSFVNSLGIASADNIGSFVNPLIFNDELTIAYNESTGYKNPPIATVAGKYDYVYIEAFGETADYTAVNSVISLKDKVVIVDRGSISFYQKGDNCYRFGPKAVIIANNQYDSGGMDLSSLVNPIPMVLMGLDDAIALKEVSEKQVVSGYNVYTGKIEIAAEPQPVTSVPASKAQISYFSSWGGNGSLLMKPEIAAPGGMIWSVNGMTSNEYEYMSGTSMAAPHTTGMAALLGQYIRDNDLEKKTGMTKRQLTNALLMSTATPLYEMTTDYKTYISVLTQGSGLANVYNAAIAKSIITVGEDATISYADGKVKAEFGEDAERTGKYGYTFYILNTSDKAITYDFDTDIFTQLIEGDKLSTITTDLEADVIYSFDFEYDVNKDGKTDTADVQAILDIVTGKAQAEEKDYNYDLADFDKDNAKTSLDAQLLLEALANKGCVVGAGEKKEVKVSIQLKDLDKLDAKYVNGLYVEGFTYIKAASSSEEGAIDDVTYSIPLYGFYGNWTDPSMYEAVTQLEKAYGVGHSAGYFNSNTNLLSVKYPTANANSNFLGNPYKTEKAIPYDRFAISGSTTVNNAQVLVIRAASNTAGFVAKVNADGTRSNVSLKNTGTSLPGPTWDDSTAKWTNTSTRTYTFGQTVSAMGFAENDRIDIGVVTVPEYYAIQLSNYTANTLSTSQLTSLLSSNDTFGEGAYFHYQFVVDNTAPVVDSVVYDEAANTVTVKAHDNNYIAYLAIRKMDGSTVIADCIPEQSEAGQTVEVVFDVTGKEIGNAINVFVGDYAANEVNDLAIVADGPIKMPKDAYVLVNAALVSGSDYVIADIDTEGSAKIVKMASTTNNTATTVATAPVHKDGDTVYILASDVANDSVWNAYKSGTSIRFGNKASTTRYLYVGSNTLRTSSSTANASYDTTNKVVKIGNYYIYPNTAGTGYSVSTSATAGHSYIYIKSTVEVEIDPSVATSVVVDPATVTLYGAGGKAQLTATVNPSYLKNKDVVWSSLNENVATVDANGLVTSVAAGTATIRATSVATDTVYGEATITVIATNPMNAKIDALINTASGAQFVNIDLNDMSTTKIADAAAWIDAGGRTVNNYFFMDKTSEVYAASTSDYEIVDLGGFGDTRYCASDMANWPDLAYPSGLVEHNDTIFGAPNGGYLMNFNASEGSISAWSLGSSYRIIGLTFLGQAFDDSEDVNALANFYYALTASGYIMQFEIFGIAEGGEEGLTLMYGNVARVSGLTLNTSSKYLAWSLAAVDEDTLLIADATTGLIYSLELNLASTTVATSNAVLVGKVQDATAVSALSNSTYDTIVTSDVVSKLHSVASEKVVAESLGKLTPSVVSGSINSVKEYFVENKPSVGVSGNIVEPIVTPNATTEDPTFVGALNGSDIKVSTVQDVTVKNGKFTVTYDSAAVELVSVSCGSDFSSYYDDGKGTIVFSFANASAITGEIATFKFNNKDCAASSISVVLNEYNTVLNLSDEKKFELAGIGHDYEFQGFEWADDYTAKAVYVCKNNSEHVVKYDAVVTSEVTTAATCENDGVRTYTATYDGHTDTKTEAIKAIGHDYEFKGFEWADDFTAKAVYVCKNNSEHVAKYDAVITSEVTTAATCENDGVRTYTATYDGHTDTKTDVIKAIGHDYELAGFEWNADHTAAKANFVCKNDPAHNFSLDAEVEEEVIKPTKDEEGSRTVVATVVFDGNEYKDTYTETLSRVPDTGDHSMTKVWMTLSAVTAVCGAVVLLKKRED